MDWIVAHCDGGSRGNPGPAGFGAVLEDERGNVVSKLSQYLGIKTNNYAEYSGLIAVLLFALENGFKRLRVVSDSQVMVMQMKGAYKVNSQSLKPLNAQAQTLAAKLEKFEIAHTLREGNKEADRLANAAMDRGGPAEGESSVVQHSDLPTLTPAQVDDIESRVRLHSAEQSDMPASEEYDLGPEDLEPQPESDDFPDELLVPAEPGSSGKDWKVVEITKYSIVDSHGITLATADTKAAADCIIDALREKRVS